MDTFLKRTCLLILLVTSLASVSGCGPTIRASPTLRQNASEQSLAAQRALDAGDPGRADQLWSSAESIATEIRTSGDDFDPDLMLRRAMYRSNRAWVRLLQGNPTDAKAMYEQSLALLSETDNEREAVKQARSDRAEWIMLGVTALAATSLAKERDAQTGQPLFTPQQLASIVRLPKFDKVTIERQFPGYSDTDGVRAILFPTTGWLRSVFKLITPSGGHCTGFLLSHSVAVTNAHCVTSNGALVRGDYRLVFSRPMGGETRGVDSITTHQAGAGWDGQPVNDWAVLTLDSPVIGPKFKGWVTLGDDTRARPDELKGNLGTAGFAADLNSGQWMGLHWGCSFVAESQRDVFEHTCRTWSGASGSPIFVTSGQWEGYLLGIHHSGEHTLGADGRPNFDDRHAWGTLFHPALTAVANKRIEETNAKVDVSGKTWIVY